MLCFFCVTHHSLCSGTPHRKTSNSHFSQSINFHIIISSEQLDQNFADQCFVLVGFFSSLLQHAAWTSFISEINSIDLLSHKITVNIFFLINNKNIVCRLDPMLQAASVKAFWQSDNLSQYLPAQFQQKVNKFECALFVLKTWLPVLMSYPVLICFTKKNQKLSKLEWSIIAEEEYMCVCVLWSIGRLRHGASLQRARLFCAVQLSPSTWKGKTDS